MDKFFLLILFPFSAIFGASLCSGDISSKSACAGWESLSQLGSLMPERIWEQEFDIIVDKKGFRKSTFNWFSIKKPERAIKSLCVLGKSHRYFLKSTMSGQNSRILDRYEEFQWSPFWKNPQKMAELRFAEKEIMKEVGK